MVGQAVPAQDNSGNIWLFVRDSVKGNLYADELPGGSGTWTGMSVNLGGNLPDNVSVVVGGGGFIHLAGVGNDGRLYNDSLPPGGSWGGWTELSGADVTGVPAITQDLGGTVHIFARQSTNGAMVTSTEAAGTTTWSSWSSIAGIWSNDPFTLTGDGGDVWVLAAGHTTDLYEDQLSTSGTWSGWMSDGGDFAGVPGLSEYSTSSTDLFHLFGVSTSGTLETDQIAAGTSTWSGWTSLGGSMAES
jgi:hypothetical protein